MKGIIIEGSARSNGNTSLVAKEIARLTGFELVHLSEKSIGHFDYEFKNQDDDFLPLMQHIVDEHELIVFITPIYWYSMSGLMKVFFDRISDCLHSHKDTGRKLRGMKIVAISSSEEDREYDGFFMPFRESANYLGMHYLGNLHTWVEDRKMPKLVKDRLQQLFDTINIPLNLP